MEDTFFLFPVHKQSFFFLFVYIFLKLIYLFEPIREKSTDISDLFVYISLSSSHGHVK